MKDGSLFEEDVRPVNSVEGSGVTDAMFAIIEKKQRLKEQYACDPVIRCNRLKRRRQKHDE